MEKREKEGIVDKGRVGKLVFSAFIALKITLKEGCSEFSGAFS